MSSEVSGNVKAVQPSSWRIAEGESGSVISITYSKGQNAIYVMHRIDNKNIYKKYPCTLEQWTCIIKSKDKARGVNDLRIVNSYGYGWD